MLAAILLIAAPVLLSGCDRVTSLPGTGVELTIGAQSADDNRVVAAIYGIALEEQGYTVDYNWGVGSRTRIISALREGIIDISPDYTGLLLEAIDSAHASGSPDVALGFLQSAADELGLSVLDPATAAKTPAYVVTREFAKAHDLTEIGDLAGIGSAITIASTSDLGSLDYGSSALAYSYGVEGFGERTTDSDAESIAALASGSAQVALVSPLSLGDDELRVLKDPRYIVLDERVVPVVNSGRLDATIESTLDAVSASLSTADLRAFAAEDSALPETVARAWLVDEGLIES
ncbi:MAG: glycine betaine ABC transporter substrate-binding protein [Microbacteriaceae bacterium]